jgi:hypothetical protein
MKRKSKLFNATLIVLSLVIGFVIGISLDFPKTNTDNLKGTIGKVNKHRDVNITDADIQLRSELVSNEEKREGYLNYYSFHYSIVAWLSSLVDSAIVVSEENEEFAQANAAVIRSLKNYKQNIENPRAELLLAVLTLQNIDEVEEAAIGTILNNANMAIARTTYNENAIAGFTSAAQEFILNNNEKNIDALINVHDKLSMVQFTKAVITKDKPMIKYYDKHEIFSDADNLSAFMGSEQDLGLLVILDSERLQAGFPSQSQLEGSESLERSFNFSNEMIQGVSLLDATKLESAKALMGVSLLNIEKLGLFSNSGLGSQINGSLNSDELLKAWDSEQLKGLWGTEQLQSFSDNERLGFMTGGF